MRDAGRAAGEMERAWRDYLDDPSIDGAKEEAVAKVRDAAENGLPDLFLNDLGLTALPPGIQEQAQLTTLGLWGNRLRVIPGWIGQLSQLEELKISNNELETLPHEICDLGQLLFLSADYNRLTALREAIGQLALLQELNVNGNQIASLPPSMSGLARLERFTVARNRLESVPEWFVSLASLRYLDLRGNQMSELPTGLESLRLSVWRRPQPAEEPPIGERTLTGFLSEGIDFFQRMGG